MIFSTAAGQKKEESKTLSRKNQQHFLADLAELSRQELATNGERRKTSDKSIRSDWQGTLSSMKVSGRLLCNIFSLLRKESLLLSRYSQLKRFSTNGFL